MLLAVINCHSREEFSDAIRSTWAPLVPAEVDLRFFRGRGATRDPLPDEVFLDCGDAYLELPEKVQAVMRWAYENGYDYAAKVDDDVICKPSQWYAGFHRADFSGWQDPGCKVGEIKTPWGFFYVLSRRAMELIINAPLPGRAGALHSHEHGNDEAWVSSVLHYQNIFLTSDPRYFLHLGEKPPPPRRPLRAPIRPSPPVRRPVENYFAACIYLNWSGFHATGTDVILREFHKVFKEGL